MRSGKEVSMRNIKIYMMLLISLIFLSGCGSHKVYRSSTMVSNPYHASNLNSGIKQKYLNAINKVRSQARSCGRAGHFSSAPALRWSDTLYKAAYEHSNDMVKSGTFSHKGSNQASDWTAKVQHLGRSSSFKERIENNGYRNWRHIAENIESGSSTVDAAMAHWVSSDMHCANIMNPRFTDVGMAYAKKQGSRLSYYWTQNFGTRQ